MTNYTHIHPIQSENLVIIFSVISTARVTTSEHTRTQESGRLRFTGHIETKQAFAIHNKMIYHFCIKRFATLLHFDCGPFVLLC